MSKVSFHRDGLGALRVDAPDDWREVALFFEDDVQNSALVCRDLLLHVEALENGRVESWVESGNAHVVRLNCDTAVLRNLFIDDLRSEVPLLDFRQALQACLAFLVSAGPPKKAAEARP